MASVDFYRETIRKPRNLTDAGAVRRCCSKHESLEQLTRHLTRDFANLDAHTIARETARALAAVRRIGVVDDELLLIELIARAQIECAQVSGCEIALQLELADVGPRKAQVRCDGPDLPR